MENNQQTEPQGVFLNGKAQIIEMLQFMNEAEKSTLIKNIRMRNPQLANELLENSLTFEHLNRLEDLEISTIFRYVQAPILGMALKNVSREFQKRILTLAPREYAEEAFHIMTAPMNNEIRTTQKAQDKIVSVLSSLVKRNQITL